MFKIYVFIDSQNLNMAIQDLGWELNFRKFIRFLKDKYKVEKVFLFIGYVEKYEEMYKSLKSYGYEIIHKPTLEYGNGKIKGNCDAELVLQCMVEYENFDQAIIVSGDGDFHCLLKHLKAQGKLFKLGIPDKNDYSVLLKEFAPYMFFVSQLKSKLQLGNNNAEK